MKCHAHGDHASHSAGLTAAGKTGIIAAGLHTGKTLLAKASKHPLILFGVGLALGIYIHKKRTEILTKADESIN